MLSLFSTALCFVTTGNIHVFRLRLRHVVQINHTLCFHSNYAPNQKSNYAPNQLMRSTDPLCIDSLFNFTVPITSPCVSAVARNMIFICSNTSSNYTFSPSRVTERQTRPFSGDN